MSSVTEGLGTSLLDAMACVAPDRRNERGRHSRNRRRRRSPACWSRRAIITRWRGRSSGCSRTPSFGARFGDAGFARVRERFTVERMVARPPPFTSAWPADAAQRALRVALRPTEAARVHHPEVTERVVVLDGIVRVELAERRCDVARHRPTRARVARQLQAAADTNNVRVERHDQLRRRTPCHTPRSSASRRTIHRRNRFSRLQPLPAEGRGKEVADARPRRACGRTPISDRARARGVEKLSSACFDIHRVRIVALDEKSFDRSGIVRSSESAPRRARRDPARASSDGRVRRTPAHPGAD